jgi:hypothetical protein
LSNYLNKTTTTQLYGKYRAIVLDTADPEMRGRVLVQCPKLSNKSALGWAESCFPPGMFFLPKKGDFLWIEFEEGDIHKPVWVGIMPTRNYVRDYLLGVSYYPTNVSFLNNYNGDINICVSNNLYNKSQHNITNLANGDFKVQASTLTNNNKWSIDDIGQS